MFGVNVWCENLFGRLIAAKLFYAQIAEMIEIKKCIDAVIMQRLLD